MEYKVGSLANIISGVKSSDKPKKTKLFKNAENKHPGITFQTVQTSKKEKRKLNSNENTSPVKHKKKKEFVHETKSNIVEAKEENPNATCAVKRIKKKRKKEMISINQDVIAEHQSRSIFVGNVPISVSSKDLRKLFAKYGSVETVRLRSAPIADPRVPKKVAVITKKFHPDRTSIHAFVRFADIESAKNALVANGMLCQDHHLRVNMASKEANRDQKKAVFLGNVPFAAEENEIWKMFESCGQIIDIRIIRDKRTGIGKGFAYINFQTSDAVELALQLDGEELKKRKLRVKRCVKDLSKKPKKENVQGSKIKKERNKDTKTVKQEEKEEVEEDDNDDDDDPPPPKRVNKTPTYSEHKISGFQGQKVAEKKTKKKKKNKTDMKKIVLRNKLLPKSKLAFLKAKRPTKKVKSVGKKMKFKPSAT